MRATTLLTSTLVVASQFLGAFAQESADPNGPKGVQPKPELAIIGTPTPQGCFSSVGNMTEGDVPATSVSTGKCYEYCLKKKFTAYAVKVSTCYCGFAYPPEDALIDDKKCNYPCPGYPFEACGSLGSPGAFSVFNAGTEPDVPNYVEEEEKEEDEGDSSSTSSGAEPTASATTSEGTESQPTDDAAAAESSAPSNHEEKSKGPNVAGIVAGVVVGLAVIAGACGGLFFYMRRKRNNEIEEEHRRNAAVNAFISGSKSPGSSGSISASDSRLDPVMAHRRMSDGSIADNEDYSRKILRVTNA